MSHELSAKPVPIRLRKDPIVEALCEIRFQAKGDAAALLPGLLMPTLGDRFPTFEKLPLASIPEPIRQADPNLQFAPFYRLSGSEGTVAIGDRSLVIACPPSRYGGWGAFRPLAVSIFESAVKTGLIKKIERLSVKYVNLIESPSVPAAIGDLTTASLKLGELQITKEHLQLRTEIPANGHISIVQLVNHATVERPGMPSLRGLVIEVDTVRRPDLEIPFDQVGQLLDAAHAEEKRVFFQLLSDATLEQCEPEYD